MYDHFKYLIYVFKYLGKETADLKTDLLDNTW